MTKAEKYDKMLIGAAGGFFLPVIIGLIVYLFFSGGRGFSEYISRIISANIVTHIISLCVFPNLFLFLSFNRFDMLNAAKGVLGVTIFWALLVFAVKFLI